jgi:hypothetical protein
MKNMLWEAKTRIDGHVVRKAKTRIIDGHVVWEAKTQTDTWYGKFRKLVTAESSQTTTPEVGGRCWII